MKSLLPLLFLIPACYGCIMAQDPVQQYAAEITPETAKAHLTTLASAAFEGRGTGEEGGEKAAAYLAEEFRKLGLTGPVSGSYYQPVELTRNVAKGELRINGTEFTNGKDFYLIAPGPETTVNTREIVFIGYGISDAKYDDLNGVDIAGKVVLVINDGEPMDARGRSLITGTDAPSEWATSRTKRLQNVLSKQPKLVLAVSNGLAEALARMGGQTTRPRITLAEDRTQQNAATTAVANISPEMADALLQQARTTLGTLTKKITRRKKSQSATFAVTDFSATFGSSSEPFTSNNVLGYLEGTDLKNELLVISAHYDHEGNQDGEIFFGADDNASGTTGVLEVARAFAKAKAEGHGPRRSILFIGFTAEEKGLLGSNYYGQHPVFPLENTVVNLNMDMIGRIDDKHLQGNHNYVHVIGADKLSSELHAINEKANATYTQMELDYMYNDPRDPMRIYYRSDQYNFAKYGIPVIFYFSGLHPDYHTPADTPDKINFEMLTKRAKLAFYTAWEVANRNNRLVVDSNKQ
ncbi:M28 family peptidase [Parapedobacter lycopersici]|uniref:M28 family peptidase n=1 Tax=Parapedobacter lycopersici TaxID=1864939 RepID=UPI00214D6B0C|nr:M28 family peptidase [Parapedobacter lycopersici]